MMRAYCEQKQENFEIFIFIYLGPRAFLRLSVYCKFYIEVATECIVINNWDKLF